MPRPSKGLTRDVHFRHTDQEAAMLRAEQARYAQNGITLSVNDTLRALVRRSVRPVPADEPTARRFIVQHWDECPVCTGGGAPKCPDGIDLREAWLRLSRPPQKAPAPARKRAVPTARPRRLPPNGSVQP